MQLTLRPWHRGRLMGAAGMGMLFVLLTVVVAGHPGALAGDRSVAGWIQQCSCSVFDPFINLVAALGGPAEVAAAFVVVAAVALLWRRALPFAVFSLGASLAYNAVVFVVRRPRPEGLPHATPSLGAFSYPSGHVVFVMWLAALVLLLVASRVGVRAAWLAAIPAAVVVVAAGLARVYVSAHWPSDVLGGLLLGSAWLLLTWAAEGLTRPVMRSG